MPGEWSEWEWDETLFAGAAAYYDGVCRTFRGSRMRSRRRSGSTVEVDFSTSAAGRAR
ncbi:MAG: hypothetical protein ACLP01_32675 [Solirubrobacteraceae bacterium]